MQIPVIQVDVVDTHTYAIGSDPRVRDIAYWSIKFMRDIAGSWVSLCGIVVKDTRPLAEGANARYTSTSPIALVQGRVVTTDSGSKYTLIGEPLHNYLELLALKGLEYDPENPIPMSLIAEG